MTFTEFIQEPGTLAMLGTLAVLAIPALILYLATRDPCPGCGKRRHTTRTKKVTGAANLKSGVRWITFDVRLVKCRTPGCTEPEEERPLPGRPATEDEITVELLR